MRKSGPKMSWAFADRRLAARLEQADLEHLARIVPLVDRRVDVEALIALQPDQPRAQARREDLRELRLADARLALEEERPGELEGEERRRRERAVADVVAGEERVLDPLDRAEGGRAGRRDGASRGSAIEPNLHRPR